MTNTKVKFVIVVESSNTSLRDNEIRSVSTRIHLNIWAASSEFVSSSIPSWQILTAHAQPFREARDLAFCLKVPLDSLLVWASCGGSGETAQMRRLAWTFAARICDKYQIRLMRSILSHFMKKTSFAICEQQSRRSNCASAQSDQHLCCSLPG